MSRLEEMYKNIKGELQTELSLANIMQVPRIEKIVINIGVKEASRDSKVLDGIKKTIELIAGQKAIKTAARNSIAGFKLREGVDIGVKVTLRRRAMYHFLDKLINIALPGVRDFQGVPTKFDGTGNYNLGIKDWMIFPEVDYDKVDSSRGLNITIHTSSSDDKAAFALLKKFKMPFRNSNSQGGVQG